MEDIICHVVMWQRGNVWHTVVVSVQILHNRRWLVCTLVSLVLFFIDTFKWVFSFKEEKCDVTGFDLVFG